MDAWSFTPDHLASGYGRGVSKALSGYEAALPDTYGVKLRGLVVKSTDAITIAGLERYEPLAEAEHTKSETPLVVYQAILFDEAPIF